ncbi:MAG: alpha/beta hydrolase [Desulfobacteraceae bacterium]
MDDILSVEVDHPIRWKLPCFVIGLFLCSCVSGCFNGSFYYPNDKIYKTPADYGLTYETVSFRSRDHTRLNGWFIPATGKPMGTVIYFYGDFANRTYYLKHIHWLPPKGFNVFTFDYRGYGDSDGKPDRSGIYLDSVAAIQYVQTRSDIDRKNLFIYGQSLGGVFAIAALAQNRFPGIRAVAVEGTFASFRAEARYMMLHKSRQTIGQASCLTWPIEPLTFVGVSDAYSPIDLVDRVSPVPLLIIHCKSDTAVPHKQAEALFQQAKAPKYLWSVQGCEHVKLFIDWPLSPKYRDRLADFFKAYGSKSP